MVTRVFVLGRVEIESEGGLITEPRFPGRQGRRLFAYLLCHRQQPVTPEELAEALWRDTPPPAWGSALHALISKLRRLLDQVGDGDTLDLTGGGGNYLLRVGQGIWIDREAVAEAIDEAEAWLRSGEVKRAWAPSNIAAITAGRPFLPGEEGDWIERERARLHAILGSGARLSRRYLVRERRARACGRCGAWIHSAGAIPRNGVPATDPLAQGAR